MGLPKNFHEKVNLPKMVESLNELGFYKIKYRVTLTEEYEKWIRESELNGEIVECDLEVTETVDKLNKICKKNYSALNDEEALRKITEWLDAKVENKNIEDYTITEISSNSFYEEIKDKGLLPLLDQDEFDRIREESK